VCWNSDKCTCAKADPVTVASHQAATMAKLRKSCEGGTGGGTLLGLQRDMLHPRKARNGVSVIPNMREHVSVAYGVADLAAAAVLVGHPV
jgi:hypothetical protein